MATKIMATIKCDRCGRRWRGQEDWNAKFKQGVVVGALCAACQTPEENAEAVINEATVDHEKGRVDEKGRFWAPPRV